jgi:hypothetical protein
MRILTLFCFLFWVLSANAQLNVGLTTVEIEGEKKIDDEAIEVLTYRILNTTSDLLKDSLNKELIALLSLELSKEDAFEHPFNAVKSMSILTPRDSSFRLFNWNIPYSDGSYSYECAVLRKEETGTFHYFLQPTKQDSINPEKLNLSDNHWIPALYYDIISTSTKFGNYYTLLGWDGNNRLTQKKIIDIIWFDGKGNAKLGAPIFQHKRDLLSRRIFELGAQNRMQLFFNEVVDRIQFDHLSPPNSTLEGIYEYYGPDLTFDAYYWNNGKWTLSEDVDPDERLQKRRKYFESKDKILEEQPVYNPKP